MRSTWERDRNLRIFYVTRINLLFSEIAGQKVYFYARCVSSRKLPISDHWWTTLAHFSSGPKITLFGLVWNWQLSMSTHSTGPKKSTSKGDDLENDYYLYQLKRLSQKVSHTQEIAPGQFYLTWLAITVLLSVWSRKTPEKKSRIKGRRDGEKQRNTGFEIP